MRAVHVGNALVINARNVAVALFFFLVIITNQKNAERFRICQIAPDRFIMAMEGVMARQPTLVVFTR